MKRHLLLFTALLGFSFASWAPAHAESGWETDLKKAQEEAKSNNKLVLLDFTGSDWCGYCMRLNHDVFSKPAFKEYASKNLVLVEIDFPRSKEQSTDLRKQNRDLAMQYEVQGFPTLVVLNGAGKKVWRHDGYFPGGPDAIIAELEKARKG
ncbi:MAG TPA: thioredoxin fold domain-containing protein [Chthoniobacterales bacterium]|nr:thioredoxin fold domain-containing protein [Chthoniobacterales bacterium]